MRATYRIKPHFTLLAVIGAAMWVWNNWGAL